MTIEDQNQVKQIIRDELSKFIVSDRYVFSKHLQLLDGKNLQVAKSTGTQIGTEGGATGQKLGFFGQVPAVQQTHIADASGGATVDAEARAAVNDVLTTLENLGFLRTS